MTIKVGDRLPDGRLTEYVETEGGGCSLGPNHFQVSELVSGRRLLIFGLPGAFTPTCSAQHVPGYVANYERFRAAGIDEIWCISVNDPHVLHAWAKDQGSDGKVRMMGDGNCDYSRALGLEIDFRDRNWGFRSRRYAMYVDDGMVKVLNVEEPGKFEVSGAEVMLAAIDGA
ncbi:peroxiredoxin [Thioalkalivibrio denitrificans]|uniref:Glutathione-dependent peroxiredoxin n=1 Tax=Thioalkalivibrio denitrificans TaxID=108003 RepID=A0A1V3NVC2_9GAMM|nr:peroxiredoxin [Thioalkalivibrio denitrificans]OOG28676.1 peroxiredoxin [Thioalkalivibrio denitrificans]